MSFMYIEWLRIFSLKSCNKAQINMPSIVFRFAGMYLFQKISHFFCSHITNLIVGSTQADINDDCWEQSEFPVSVIVKSYEFHALWRLCLLNSLIWLFSRAQRFVLEKKIIQSSVAITTQKGILHAVSVINKNDREFFCCCCSHWFYIVVPPVS